MAWATCPLLHSSMGGDEVVTTLTRQHALLRGELRSPRKKRRRSAPRVELAVGRDSPIGAATYVPKREVVSPVWWTVENLARVSLTPVVSFAAGDVGVDGTRTVRFGRTAGPESSFRNRVASASSAVAPPRVLVLVNTRSL
jgi:hypothetical protein